MDASVLIPTRGRPEQLGRCLAHLARQNVGRASFEVVVAFDGPDPEGAAAAERVWNAHTQNGHLLRTLPLEHRGYTHARNELVLAARGRIMVSINDDVRPDERFVSTHIDAQDHATRLGSPAIVVGHSPYALRRDGEDTLLDRLVRETSMVFFYDSMTSPAGRADRERDWGFRHCFGLNFSAPMDLVRGVGMFTALEHVYGYDDIELGFRLATRHAMPVLFCPEALAPHDHWYEPDELLAREEALGEAAWAFAHVNPAFGLALFGRDVTGADELSYSRVFIERERALVDRLRPAFAALGRMPASAIDGAHVQELRELVVHQHLLLKRWHWRAGLIRSAAGSAAGDQPAPGLGAEPAQDLQGVR